MITRCKALVSALFWLALLWGSLGVVLAGMVGESPLLIVGGLVAFVGKVCALVIWTNRSDADD